MTKNSDAQKIKVTDITRLRFYEIFSDYPKEENETADFYIGGDIVFSEDKNALDIICDISFERKQEKELLFGIVVVYEFENIEIKNKDLKPSNSILQICVSIAFSGARGKLNSSIELPQYKNVIFPLLNTKKITEKLLKGHKN